MTSESDFQAALDADRFDWQLRLVFADWLQDRDDPRAEGMRALGVCQLTPISLDARDVEFAWRDTGRIPRSVASRGAPHQLPLDWYKLLRVRKKRDGRTEPFPAASAKTLPRSPSRNCPNRGVPNYSRGC